jgi:probable rRNA maturation factor
VLNRQRIYSIRKSSVEAICFGILEALNREPCALTAVFVGPGEMRRLNRSYRGKDCATDVLSFVLETGLVDGLPYLGELVVAPFVAHENACRWRTSPEGEIRKLLIHGMLHLLGYDHEADKGEMLRVQARLLRRNFVVKIPPVARLKEPR